MILPGVRAEQDNLPASLPLPRSHAGGWGRLGDNVPEPPPLPREAGRPSIPQEHLNVPRRKENPIVGVWGFAGPPPPDGGGRVD